MFFQKIAERMTLEIGYKIYKLLETLRNSINPLEFGVSWSLSGTAGVAGKQRQAGKGERWSDVENV